MSVGLGTALIFYVFRPDIPKALARAHKPLHHFLLNKWYFDEIYEFLFVAPAKSLGRILWKKGDLGVIDGALHAVAMGAVPLFTRLASRAQSGFLFHYAFAMVMGAFLILAAAALFGGG